jgi:cell division septum initiation protein DivIVA
MDAPPTTDELGHTVRPAFAVVRRGYDQVQVEKYLDSLEDDVGALRSRIEKLEAELEDARQQAETAPRYAAVSDHVAQVMQALDEEVDRLRAQANEEVERIISEARADADRIEGLRRSIYGKLRRSRNAIDEALSDLDLRVEESEAQPEGSSPESRSLIDR